MPETVLREVTEVQPHEVKPVVVAMPEEVKEQQRTVEVLLASILAKLDVVTLEARELGEQMEGSVLQAEVLQALTLAPKDNRIRSQATYNQGWECLRSLQYVKKRLDDVMSLVIKRADGVHDLLLVARNAVEQPATDMKGRLKEQVEKFFLWLLANWRTQQEEFPDEASVLKLRKMKGGSVTPKFGAEVKNVKNKLMLIAFVAENPQYERYLNANMSALNSVAKGEGTAMSIPGVTAIQKVTVSVNAWK